MKKQSIKKAILELFREMYGQDLPEKDILSIDPNSFDKDPAEFFESVQNEFNLDLDYENNPYFGGLGGTIAQLIDFVAKNHKEEETDKGDPLLIFLQSYIDNFDALNPQNVKMHFNMFSMMEGRKATKEVKDQLKKALKTNEWGEIYVALSTLKQKKEMFNLESLQEVARAIN